MRKYSCSGPTVVKIRWLAVVAEQAQGLQRGVAQRVHRAQQRDLVVQRLARPRHERRRDAQERPVRVRHDERRRGGVPCGVAAGLERDAQAAGGEGRRVGLALDQLLAGEVGDRRAVSHGLEEAVVLLGREVRQRLEPVRVVGGALRHRPLAHRLGDGVGEGGVKRAAAAQGRLQGLERALGQTLALNCDGEDVVAEVRRSGNGEVRRAEGVAVGAPLCGVDVVLTGLAHRGLQSSGGCLG